MEVALTTKTDFAQKRFKILQAPSALAHFFSRACWSGAA